MDNEITYIKLDDIVPNRFQPREYFDEKALNELADSIRQHGVIEPILVRPVSNKFEIVAGERRYKASALAGLTKIPAIVKQLDDKQSSIIAYIENAHRKDVSAIEEARTTSRILKSNNMTQEELSKELGVSQSTIANKLRLLNLPLEVQDALMKNEISERHARSLLGVKDSSKQIELLNKIKEKKMTVRELDSEIKMMNSNDMMNNNLDMNGQNVMPQDPNFTNFLNNYDNNVSTPAPENNVQAPDPNFTNFLNNYDNNVSTPAPENNVQAPDPNFTNFLNNYDNNVSTPAPENNVQAPDPNFTNFLNNYDNNAGIESTNQFLNNYTNVSETTDSFNESVANNGVLINNVNPPITSNFNANSYVEDNPNFVDVSKEVKIETIDEVIGELNSVVNKIKTQSVFKVDTEEINYDDIYQITIKIDKRENL